MIYEQFFKESYASTSVNESNLDQSKIQLLSKHINLIKKLDEWTLIPDKRLIPYIIQLGQIVDSIYKFTYRPIPIYRGFSPKINYQNDMGLCDKGFFSRKLKPGVKPGYVFSYTCINPTSFTFDLNIAKDFGSCLIQSILPKTNRLIITDELIYLIHKLRNLDQVDTQKEIIIFNNQELKCIVIKV